MANITYRESATPTVPGSTTAKLTPLTNLEVDANFKALDVDIQTRATTATVTNLINTTAADTSVAMAIALG